MPPTSRRPGGPVAGRARLRSVPKATDDRFFRHIVSSMRNGVIAIRRDGTLALMNDEAYRIFSLARRPDDIGPAVRRGVPRPPGRGPGALERVRADDSAEPRRAAAEGHRPRDRLHAVAGQGRRGRADRRRAVLQGPDAGRAAGGARTAARPAGLARRDGGGHRARAEEPARGHRGDGRAPAPAGARFGRRRSRCSPTSSAKPSWPTPSSSRCSSSCGRSGCRSSGPTSATSSSRR